jgi:alanyl-tRNA synthetase
VQALWFDLKDKLGATEFLGYTKLASEAQVVALVKDGKTIDKADASSGLVYLIVNQTPFYGESGGQVGDHGTLLGAEGTTGTISDTQKQLGLFIHSLTLNAGSIKLGDNIKLMVDAERRNDIKANHSATHLLHEALRRRLGDHVTQKGSLVSDDRLRFDISHNKPLSAEDIEAVEREVNARIRLSAPVETRLMTPDEAIKAGAMALFGEKYGDEVRVISMGGSDEGKSKAFSLELCGGTHVSSTGEIGLLKIISDSAVSAGVRRIEAITGRGALQYFDTLQEQALRTAQQLGAQLQELPTRVQSLLDEKRAMEKELSDLRRKLAMAGSAGGSAAQGTGSSVREIGGVKLDARVIDLPAKDLKPMVDELKKQIGSGVVALVSTAEGKASIVVGVTADLTSRLSAVDLVKTGAEACGGKGGGGRPDLAQAGGPDGANANAALEAIARQIG